MFVARYTNHPAEDLQRNWSAPIGGFFDQDLTAFETEEQIIEQYVRHYGEDNIPTFRFHPAYGGFVQVDYEGLGAYRLYVDTLEEAIADAEETFGSDPCNMYMCAGAGTGHFYANQCVGYYETNVEGLYIFEIN